MNFSHVSGIRVSAWDREVGFIVPAFQPGYYAFQYSPRWLGTGIELAPLTTPLSARTYIGTGLPRSTFHGLPSFVADSLPDAFGGAIVTAALAREGVTPDQITTLDRLAYVGHRGMGALTFEPAHEVPAAASRMLAIAELVDAARSVIHGNVETEPAAVIRQLLEVSGSAGGAQAKAVVGFDPATGNITGGPQLLLSGGYFHALLKLDLGDESPRIEYAYDVMARDAGLTLTDSVLIEDSGRGHLLTRRFDRDGDKRMHTQTLCAVNQLDFNAVSVHDYHQYLQTATQLGLRREDLTQAFRRIVFNFVAAVTDDHTKNFSFLRRQSGPWELAPAYDLTYTQGRHAMLLNGLQHPTIKDFITFADRHRIPDARSTVRDVVSVVQQWPDYARAARLNSDTAERIYDAQRDAIETLAMTPRTLGSRARAARGPRSARVRTTPPTRCGAWMPIAERACALPIGHAGHHR